MSLNAVASTELEMYDACLRWVESRPQVVEDQGDESNSDVYESVMEVRHV